MHLYYTNVNEAFREVVRGMHTGSIPTTRRTSRNGTVLQIEEPVTITYSKPRFRVLFNDVRDCNPAFHLYESLWMLAGRNDVTPLAYYASKMKDFSDDGKTLNGAYGYRWRRAPNHFPTSTYSSTRLGEVDPGWQTLDQLDLIVQHLKADPNSRRAVLQMWNVQDDLLKIGESRDVCCNLSVMFSTRSIEHPDLGEVDRFLDITVTNRSNDLVWGLLGANVVHFSFLQEYMAARLGCEVGKYHHFTNNLHAYDWNWKPEEWLAYYERLDGSVADYDESGCHMVPLVKDPETFERELPLFVGAFNGEEEPWDCVGQWEEPFFQNVAGPALTAFRRHKQGKYEQSQDYAEEIEADDWRVACREWLQRRVERRASNATSK